MITGIWKRSDNGYTREFRFHIPRLVGQTELGGASTFPAFPRLYLLPSHKGIKEDIHNDVPSSRRLKENPRLYIFLST